MRSNVNKYMFELSVVIKTTRTVLTQRKSACRLVDRRCSMAVGGAIMLCAMATKCIGSTITCAIRSHHFFGGKVRFPAIFLWLQKSDQITVMHKLNCAQITVLRLYQHMSCVLAFFGLAPSILQNKSQNHHGCLILATTTHS